MTKKMWTGLAAVGLSAAVLATAVPGVSQADTGPGGMGAALLLDRFDQVDADKDGKVTKAEVEAFRAARFAAADTDKNGSLSPEELAAFQEQEMAARKAARATRMLERLDANSDGQLSAEEFAAMGQRRSPFDRADTDGDGAVSKAEAEVLMKDMAGRGGHGGKHGKRGHGGGDGGWWWQDAN